MSLKQIRHNPEVIAAADNLKAVVRKVKGDRRVADIAQTSFLGIFDQDIMESKLVTPKKSYTVKAPENQIKTENTVKDGNEPVLTLADLNSEKSTLEKIILNLKEKELLNHPDKIRRRSDIAKEIEAYDEDIAEDRNEIRALKNESHNILIGIRTPEIEKYMAKLQNIENQITILEKVKELELQSKANSSIGTGEFSR